MDYQELLYCYVTCTEWKSLLKSFFVTFEYHEDKHKKTTASKRETPGSAICKKYKQKAKESDNLLEPQLTEEQFKRYFSTQYSERQRCAIVFGLWWGLPEDKIEQLSDPQQEKHCWELLNQFLSEDSLGIKSNDIAVKASDQTGKQYGLDYKKLLEYYLTSELWEGHIMMFFYAFNHCVDIKEGYWNPQKSQKQREKDCFRSDVFLVYEKKLEADGGTPKLHLTDEQIAEYFSRKYSETQRFTIIFGLWWGLPEDEIQQLCNPQKVLNEFLCNSKPVIERKIMEEQLIQKQYEKAIQELKENGAIVTSMVKDQKIGCIAFNYGEIDRTFIIQDWTEKGGYSICEFICDASLGPSVCLMTVGRTKSFEEEELKEFCRLWKANREKELKGPQIQDGLYGYGVIKDDEHYKICAILWLQDLQRSGYQMFIE